MISCLETFDVGTQRRTLSNQNAKVFCNVSVIGLKVSKMYEDKNLST